jgi:hypothetical protein
MRRRAHWFLVRLMAMRTSLCGEPICPLRPPLVAANPPLACAVGRRRHQIARSRPLPTSVRPPHRQRSTGTAATAPRRRARRSRRRSWPRPPRQAGVRREFVRNTGISVETHTHTGRLRAEWSSTSPQMQQRGGSGSRADGRLLLVQQARAQPTLEHSLSCAEQRCVTCGSPRVDLMLDGRVGCPCRSDPGHRWRERGDGASARKSRLAAPSLIAWSVPMSGG